jgi:ribonuclease HI
MNKFYAVGVGLKPGVYMSWDECKKQVENQKDAVFKKFETIEEAASFVDEHINNLYVYTDGSCINNGSKNAKAGIGIYFSKDNPDNVSRELDNTQVVLTNNIAELVACIEAIEIIKKNPAKNKTIVTDSEYIIKCATGYGKKLAANNWKTSTNKTPPNLELVKRLFELTNECKIKYIHVMAHTNNKDKHSIGNYYADLLANKAINHTPRVESENTNKKIYLNVSFQEKDAAKAKGARWDPSKKKWYIFEDNKNKEELLKKYSS